MWTPGAVERLAVKVASRGVPDVGLPADDLRQEATIALWRTARTRREGDSSDAVRVAHSAMIDATRRWGGRVESSRRRPPAGGLIEYEDQVDARSSPDCPLSSAMAREALEVLRRHLTDAQRNVVEAVVAFGERTAAAKSLGISEVTLHQHLRCVRQLLRTAIDVPAPGANQHTVGRRASA